jgi:hypothetical protein
MRGNVLDPLTGFECSFETATAAVNGFSVRLFLTTIGFAPAASFFMPSRTRACARRGGGGGAVAGNIVGLCRDFFNKLCTPCVSKGVFKFDFFRNGVTPSLVINGEPYFLSSTTLRPLGAKGDFYGVSQFVQYRTAGLYGRLAVPQFV